MEPPDDLIFLGYRVKRPWAPGPAWAPIELVCCVGEELSEPPEGWVDRWDFNRGFCYETPQKAWATVTDDPAPYRLFAYFLLPHDLYQGEPEAIAPLDEILSLSFPELATDRSFLSEMSQLGFDVAECQQNELGFPYSPLVNNGFSHEFPINRYGLLDDLETAKRACELINARMPEHAPHWVFLVFGEDVDSVNGSESHQRPTSEMHDEDATLTDAP